MRTTITIGKVVITIETDEDEPAAVVSRIESVPELHPVVSRIEEEKKSGGNGIVAHPLSNRETRILELLSDEGLSNKQIALRLCITEATCKVHLKSILRKLQVNNRTQAALAHQNGATA